MAVMRVNTTTPVIRIKRIADPFSTAWNPGSVCIIRVGSIKKKRENMRCGKGRVFSEVKINENENRIAVKGTIDSGMGLSAFSL